MKKLFLLLFGFVFLIIPSILQAEVAITNLVIAQREGTKLVDVSYDVLHDSTNEVCVMLSVKNGTDSVGAFNATGDIGENVLVGTNKSMVWDMSADWNEMVSSNMGFSLAVFDEPPPQGMAIVPAGTNAGTDPEYGSYSLTLESFCMDKYEVTNDEMVRVMQWACDNGKLSVSNLVVKNIEGDQQVLLDLNNVDCRITWDGSSFGMKSEKGSGYPCVEVTWYGAAAYCNYRAEIEDKGLCYNLNDWSFNIASNGYRLPTNDEWEYAARGGLSGQRFPWGDTITHNQANYFSSNSYNYDISSTRGYHPDYDDGDEPYTSPVGTFPSNGYGLYDMAGNVYEWCNTAEFYYIRSGCWGGNASQAASGVSIWEWNPENGQKYNGFRAVCRYSNLKTASVSADSILLDSRNYKLMVSSDHGTPTPDIGTNVYAWRSMVACAIENEIIENDVRWQCSGWSGSGSVPALGATNATGVITLSNVNSSIAWGWDYVFSVSDMVVTQREGTKLVDVSYSVSCGTTNEVQISFSVNDGGESVTASNLTGDVGTRVLIGTNKSIVWNMGEDWNGNVSTGIVFKLIASEPPPKGMLLIPGGTNAGTDLDLGSYSLMVDSFYMNRYEVSNDEMVQVMQWAYDHGKLIVSVSSVKNAQGDQQELLDLGSTHCLIVWNGAEFEMEDEKSSGYPCLEVSWYGAAAYCNYLSEMEGRTPCYNFSDWSCDFGANGYRLSTGMEWEYAARGGLNSKRFPWGDTIQHVRANYYSSAIPSYSYDTNPNSGYHPNYEGGGFPYPSPLGEFNPNEYGLYDMSGNAREWCNDASGSNRMTRGGGWSDSADCARCGRIRWRDAGVDPSSPDGSRAGFRTVCRSEINSTSTTNSVDARDYTLSVSSDYGVPVPNIGTNTYAWRSVVTCSVNAVVSENDIEYTCTGWLGTESVPASGMTNATGAITLTNLSSSLIWSWNAQAIDSDGDGLPDWWERLYFVGVTNANPVAPCSNGVNTVRHAYIAGFDPNNTDSLFLTSILPGKILQWSCVSGRVYSVWWTTNLLDDFQPLETNLPWTQGSYTNPDAPPCSYYKIKVELSE